MCKLARWSEELFQLLHALVYALDVDRLGKMPTIPVLVSLAIPRARGSDLGRLDAPFGWPGQQGSVLRRRLWPAAKGVATLLNRRAHGLIWIVWLVKLGDRPSLVDVARYL